MMSSFDAIILIVLLILLARGVWIGFIRQIASILALVLGFVVAGRFYGESAALVIPFVHNQQAGFLIAYSIIFLLVFLAVHLLGLGLKKVMSISLLSWFDRTLGGVFGLAKGIFISSLLFMTMAAFISDTTIFKDSFFAPFLEQSSEFIIHVIKDKDLRSDFLPRQPAISSILTNSLKFNGPGTK
jgi:membrane protein required for colicin V production